MSISKVLKTSLSIALLSLFLGFNSFLIQDAVSASPIITQPISNTQTEKQEFKQLIDQTHAAWNSHNPDA